MADHPPAVVAPTLTRAHRTRLLHIWRSGGWPCRDALEIDLLAAALVQWRCSADGRETLHLTEAGVQCLAHARVRSRRALSAHDRLAERVAVQLAAAGRVVWRELSLRARVDDESPEAAATAPHPATARLWPDDALPCSQDDGASVPTAWRMARPDVFSVRNTTVESYLQPVVHEVKVSRADLLSDLRHVAKRQAYQWLCSECYYVYPAGLAEPHEIPEDFGLWVLHGDIESGHLEPVRAARHASCQLPFPVWMALAKAPPWQAPELTEGAQRHLGEGVPPAGTPSP